MSQPIFKNPYVLSPPVITGSSIGDGTLTIDRVTHFTINQKYTAICSAISPFTVFNIVGEFDGVVGVAVVGTQFKDEDLKIFLTIQQGPTLFQIGDTFEFEVAQGTDLNQQNLDLYDELPQKNFGLGQVGLLKGDNNIRFSSNPSKAFRAIQDLLFESKIFGPEGNEVSIEYIEGSLLTPASLTLQSLTFTANTAGANGNNISIEYEEFTPGTFAIASIQDVDFQAVNMGTSGNLISIEYVGGGTQGAEVVTVVGNKITIQIEDGVTTADDIEVAISMEPDAYALVQTTGTGLTGAEPQFIQLETFLAGGTDQIGDSVEVVGNAIKVKFQGGVTTAEDVKALLDANVEALTLITTTITGGALTTQTTPVAPTFLSGGSEDVGIPGFEVVQVVGKEIKISFVDGLSTAQQIKDALEANVSVNALIDITLLGDGSEFQSSPNVKTALAGGSEGGSYSFNRAEISDDPNFFEGNAPILHSGQVNQGDEITLGETLKKGKVTLDDDVVSNNSGLPVDNAQKSINNLIQNGKAFLITEDNSKVDWQVSSLNFTSDIIFVFPDTGVFNRILVADSPLTIADGQHAYVTVNRLVNSNITVQYGTLIPKDENVFRLFSRRGDDLIWYDNTLQRDKKKIRIGEGGGGGTAFQENLGSGNGTNKNFPLTFIPSNEFSILVVCSHIREHNVDYIYNVVGNQIEFQNGFEPQFGQDVYVFYLTDGETLDVPSPQGLLNSYTHLVTAADELVKEITLINTPAQPSKVLVDIIGGGAQEYNQDFTVSVNKFQWSGFALDGDLVEGDKVRFYFYS
jgi:hypothetical protein